MPADSYGALLPNNPIRVSALLTLLMGIPKTWGRGGGATRLQLSTGLGIFSSLRRMLLGPLETLFYGCSWHGTAHVTS